MVIVVLVAFAAGCAFGVLAMVPSWWRHRRWRAPVAHAARADTAPLPEPTTAVAVGHRAARSRRAKACSRAMDFDLQWLLLGLPVAFALGWIASRIDLRPVEARAARSAEGLLQGPEPAAQRAARQGDRRLHRGGAARPRHRRAALRARQPVPPPRRVRARGARAPAPAAARRPGARPNASARSTRWRKTS